MASDLHIVQDLLARRAIEHKTSGDSVKTTIEIEEGYVGFYILFDFDKDGKLIEIGAYE